MRKEIKEYCRYYVRSNIKLIALISVILFIAISFHAFTANYEYDMSLNRMPYGYEIFSFSTYVSLLVFACVMPIIMFRFMKKRSSCDMYYSLPIQRKQLFKLQYGLGLCMVVVPYTINLMIALVLYSGKIANLMSVSLVLYILLLYVVFFALYSIITLLVMKTNNMLDTIILTIAAVILPMILYTSFQSFLSSQISSLFVSEYVAVAELFDIEKVFMYISPFKCAQYYNYSSFLLHGDSEVFLTIYIPIVYWFALGLLSLYFARTSFIQNKEEDSEQRTTSIITYPLMIILCVTSLILATFSARYEITDMLISIVTIFVVYMIMTFVWKRRVQLRIKEIAFFVLIYAIAFSFTAVFQSTKGFHIIDEVPNINDVKTIEIAFQYNYDDPMQADRYERDGYSTPGYIETITNKDRIKKIHSIQKELVALGKEDLRLGYAHDESIMIVYYLKNEKKIERMYTIYDSKGRNVMMKAMDIFNW